MSKIIDEQNEYLLLSWREYTGTIVTSNHRLADALKINPPPEEYDQDYLVSNIMVKVIWQNEAVGTNALPEVTTISIRKGKMY